MPLNKDDVLKDALQTMHHLKYKKFLVLNTQFLVLNTKFIIFARCQPRPVVRVAELSCKNSSFLNTKFIIFKYKIHHFKCKPPQPFASQPDLG